MLVLIGSGPVFQEAVRVNGFAVAHQAERRFPVCVQVKYSSRSVKNKLSLVGLISFVPRARNDIK